MQIYTYKYKENVVLICFERFNIKSATITFTCSSKTKNISIIIAKIISINIAHLEEFRVLSYFVKKFGINLIYISFKKKKFFYLSFLFSFINDNEQKENKNKINRFLLK